jgi:hypothetical protein
MQGISPRQSTSWSGPRLLETITITQ